MKTITKIENWFPTAVLVGQLDFNYEPLIARTYEIQKLSPLGHEWFCNTYNSMSYNLKEDPVFKPIFNELIYFPKELADHFKAHSKKLVCTNAWVNIAQPGAYQEYHIHPKNHFSLVLYLKTPENCGNIRFRHPSDGESMFPLPVTEFCGANYLTCSYVPHKGMVLCFRSNISHMVELNKSKEDRISLSLNFELLDN